MPAVRRIHRPAPRGPSRRLRERARLRRGSSAPLDGERGGFVTLPYVAAVLAPPAVGRLPEYVRATPGGRSTAPVARPPGERAGTSSGRSASERGTGTGRDTQGRVRPDLRREARAVGRQRPALRRLGDLPRQGIPGRP